MRGESHWPIPGAGVDEVNQELRLRLGRSLGSDGRKAPCFGQSGIAVAMLAALPTPFAPPLATIHLTAHRFISNRFMRTMVMTM